MSDSASVAGRNLVDDLNHFEADVARFLAGKITPAMFKAKRVPMGVYEQRQNGSYMQRIRVPGGRLSAAAAAAVAATAEAFSSEPLHITTRQDIQLHGLAVESLPAAMKQLGGIGISSRGGGGNTVRNISACSYAGICPSGIFDVLPYVDAVTEYMLAIDGAYNLPRKYKITFSSCGSDCSGCRINDLGFVAEVRDGKPGFRVYSGGGMGSGSRIGGQLEEWIPAGECIAAAEAMRRVFDRHGDRKNRSKARLRFVFDRLGHDAVRTEYLREKEALLASGDFRRAGQPGPSVSGSAGQGRPPLEKTGSLWTVRQSDGLAGVRFFFDAGLITAEVLRRVAGLAERYSATGMMRLTEDQGILVESVAAADLDALAGKAAEISPSILDKAWKTSLISCAGAATCRLGLCLSRDLVRACASELDRRGVDSVLFGEGEIRINGCPNACGKHLVGNIGMSGAAKRVDGVLYPFYSIYAGGRAGADPAFGELMGTVPAKAVPGMLADILGRYGAEADGGESLQAYLDRRGRAYIRSVVEASAQLPADARERGYAIDWGSNEAFSLAGRGAGECGAGVFEVVSEDIESAKKKIAEARNGTAGALEDAFLTSVRALLIVRGVDEVDADPVIREFEKHFIDAGLVSENFRPLLARGRAFFSGVHSALDGQADAVGGLLDRVVALYDSLDSSLQFNVRAEGGVSGSPAAGSDADAVVLLDLKGVACPMNFVKAKLKLETVPVGGTLGVTLDDGEPVRNVPESFRQEGQQVVGIEPDGTGHWKVFVKRIK